MSCPTIDWKAYVLDELQPAESRAAADHATACAACREELERLRLTAAALRSVPDEEPPRRIAFVSDKVFEPGWWQRLWHSGPRLGFVSAAMLSIAILVSAFTRPAPAPVPATGPDRAQVASLVESELQKRLAPVVTRAVAEAVAGADARNDAKTRQVVADLEKHFEFERKADLLAIDSHLTYLRKQLNRAYAASASGPGGGQ